MSQFTPRGSRWNATRALVLERDDYTCQQCGSTESLEVDHIIALSTIENAEARNAAAYSLNNLRTLCKKCNGRKGAKAVTRSTWFSRRWLDRVV